MRITEPLALHISSSRNHLPPLLQRGIEDILYFEQIKALRAKIESRIDRFQVKVIALTSSIAGEGKTLSCANLAANLSSAGMKKVLLMDIDLRKGDLSRGMGVNVRPGVGEYLEGAAGVNDIVRDSINRNLRFVPSGSRSTDPTDLLGGERFRAFLHDAREQYDVVLLDTPPVLPVADTLTIRDQVDGFVFLFRAGYTPHQMLKQSLEEVGEERVFGVVLNGVEAKSSKYYHRYYGKYYHQK